MDQTNFKTQDVSTELIEFRGNVSHLPKFKGIYFNVLHDKNNNIQVDRIDFGMRKILRRTFTPLFVNPIKISEIYKDENSFNVTESYLKDILVQIPHTCHTPSEKYLFMTNAYSIICVDTNRNKAMFIPESFDEKLMLYSKTNCFSNDYKFFYFIRWPMEDMVSVRNGKAKYVRCEICRLKLDSFEIEQLHTFSFPEDVHQVSISADNKYLVLTSFVINYPQFSDPNILKEMKKYYKAGLHNSKVATYDIHNNKLWETQLPVPSPGHFELDPDDSSMIYVSAHNLFVLPQIGTVGGGYASIIKLKIGDNQTNIVDSFSDSDCLRTTQHRVFTYNGKKLLVFTTTPFKFTIVDLMTMTVYRKIRIYPDPKPEPTKEGYFVFEEQSPLSLEISKDSKYIIAASNTCFYIYGMDEDYLFDVILYLPRGRGIGHTFPFKR